MVKLLFPDGNFTKDDLRKCIEYALVGRRRVKEQLKKIGGMEFYDVHFSYIDLEDNEEHFVGVPESGGKSVSLRLSAGKALDFNSRVTGNIVEFLALAE